MSNISQLSLTQNIILGSIGSTIEVFLQHPLSIIKNTKQYNKPIIFNHRFLYKGVFLSASSASLITSVQYASYAKFYQLFNKNMSNNCSSTLASIMGGISISLFITPFEMGVIQKSKNYKLTTKEIFRKNLNVYGSKFLYRGFLNTCGREIIYVFGFLGLTPYIEQKLNYEIKSINSLIATTSSGILSSIISHPFDTIKTVQQYKMYNPIQYNKFTLNNLFTGCFYRTLRNCTCYFILNETNKFFIKYI